MSNRTSNVQHRINKTQFLEDDRACFTGSRIKPKFAFLLESSTPYESFMKLHIAPFRSTALIHEVLELPAESGYWWEKFRVRGWFQIDKRLWRSEAAGLFPLAKNYFTSGNRTQNYTSKRIMRASKAFNMNLPGTMNDLKNRLYN